MFPLLQKVFFVTFPVFSIIGLGYLFARIKTITLRPVIEILLYLTIPALVISSLTEQKIFPKELALIAFTACCVVAGTGLITYLYFTVTKKPHRKGFYMTTMFMNSANLPFPLALLAFGTEGLMVVVLYYITISVLVYSIGIYIAKGRGGMGEMFKLPLLYSAVIGIAINLGGVELPLPIKTTMDMLGAATIPMMQIALGYQLYTTKPTQIGSAFTASIIRMAGGLLVAYVVVSLLGIEGVARSVILLTSAMPSAVITFIMSHRYKVEPEFVASTVAISTLLSIAVVPLLLIWLM